MKKAFFIIGLFMVVGLAAYVAIVEMKYPRLLQDMKDAQLSFTADTTIVLFAQAFEDRSWIGERSYFYEFKLYRSSPDWYIRRTSEEGDPLEELTLLRTVRVEVSGDEGYPFVTNFNAGAGQSCAESSPEETCLRFYGGELHLWPLPWEMETE